MSSETLKGRAQKLLATALHESPSCYDATIFDTALAASLEKSVDNAESDNGRANKTTLLFPEAFTWLVSRQQAHGGWDNGVESSPLDCVLNGMAGLLALVKFERRTSHDSTIPLRSLGARVRKAQEYLNEQLRTWNPESDSHRPAIHLVAKVSQLLRAEDVVLPFLNNGLLDEVIVRILSRGVKPPSPRVGDMVTAIYSMNPRSGAFEIAKLEPDKSRCGVAYSPAATALHMLETGFYDRDYMKYLQRAMEATGGNGVPVAFPVRFIEKASIFEAIVDSGLLNDNTRPPTLLKANGAGSIIVSSAISDTEASKLAMRLLNHQRSGAKDSQKEALSVQKALIRSLEKDQNDLSLEVRCLVIKALIKSSSEEDVHDAIRTSYEELCNSWWTGKWNLTLCHSEFYAIMLFAQVFQQLSQEPILASSWDRETTAIRAPIMITQMLARVLSGQQANGAWGSSHRVCLESTAFALRALTIMFQQPFLKPLALEIRQSIEKGRDVLRQRLMSPKPLRNDSALWLGPTAHRSNQLCEAYVLAALSHIEATKIMDVNMDCSTDRAHLKTFALSSFFHSNPNISNEQLFKIKSGAVESTFYVQKLKAIRHDIFPATDAKEKDKYFDYIPIMWTMHNNIRGARAPPVLIWDICVVSLYIFLVDEYMEGHVVQLSYEELGELRTGIEKMFALDDFWPAKLQAASECAPDSNPLLKISLPSEADIPRSPRVHEALEVLSRWASHYMTYPSLLQASSMDLLSVRMEAKNYLLCHLVQIADNQRLTSQSGFSPTTPFGSPGMGYAQWLHNIGGGHIGAALALTWFAACVGSKIRGSGQDCFSTPKQKLMLWNANSHSSKQLRMFNDYGSVIRDFEERNLNSTNFPEFFGTCDQDWMNGAGHPATNGHVDDYGLRALDQEFGVMERKQVLLDAAYYERHRTNEELDGLYAELRKEGAKGTKLAEWLGLYLSGGDQFSDMYLLRDVTNSTK